MLHEPLRRLACTFSSLFFSFALSAAHAAHGIAMGATPKYPAGFPHFAWANPNAPKPEPDPAPSEEDAAA